MLEGSEPGFCLGVLLVPQGPCNTLRLQERIPYLSPCLPAIRTRSYHSMGCQRQQPYGTDVLENVALAGAPLGTWVWGASLGLELL